MSTQKTPRQNVLPNDTFNLTGAQGWMYGDSSGSLLGKTDVGGDDTFYGASNTIPYTNDGSLSEEDYYSEWFDEYDRDVKLNQAIGDAEHIGGSARGGQDYFLGGNYAINDAAGDAHTMDQSSKGGNDTLLGGMNSDNTLIGDAYEMTDTARGGIDRVVGGDAKAEKSVNPEYDPEDIRQSGIDITNLYVDEAPTRDISGDVDAYNFLLGDAYAFGSMDGLDNGVLGGADIITGGSAIAAYYSASTDNIAQGDAYVMGGHGTGGNDNLTGGDSRAGVFYYQNDQATASTNGTNWFYDNNDDYNEWYEGDAFTLNLMNGDAYAMGDWANGGNDTMRGGNAFAGNSNSIDLGAGENDEYGADAITYNWLSGDAIVVAENAHTGDDVLIGGNATGLTSAVTNGITTTGVLNLLSGDAFVMFEGSNGPIWFGNDTITGGNSTYDTDGQVLNLLFGDIGDVGGQRGIGFPIIDSVSFGDLSALGDGGGPGYLYGQVNGGSDILRGGSGAGVENYLYGDAYKLGALATGGFDTLYGGDLAGTVSYLYGDAYFMEAGSTGGKDTLVSGSGEDHMWGDAEINAGTGGADRFIFRTNCGNDTVYDYNYYEGDKIDLSGFNTGRKNATEFKNFDSFINSSRFSQDGDGDLLIDLNVNGPGSNSVTIVGLSLAELTSDMFIF